MIPTLFLIFTLAFCKAEVDIVAFTVAEDTHRNASVVTTVPYPKAITSNHAQVNMGVFTCEVSGLYKFQAYALTQTDEQLFLDMYHNDQLVASLWAHTTSDYADAGNAIILNLVAGDTVQIKSRDGYHVATFGSSDEIYSTFTGVQLGTYPNDKAPVSAFSVGLTAHQSVPAGAAIIYDSVHVDTDNAYNVTSGTYTAPSSGIYEFHFFSLARRDFEMWQGLYQNDQYVCSLYGETSQEKPDAGNTAILHLKAGDQIQVRADKSTANNIYGAPNEMYSTFSGYLLVPEDMIDAPDTPTAYFSAGLSQSQTYHDNDKVVFDRVFTDHGTFNHYNHLNGEFTAPYSGIYEFNFHALGQRTREVWLELYINHKYIDSLYSHVSDGYGAAGNAAVVEMDAGDVAYIRSRETNRLFGDHEEVYCTFSGALLHPRDGVVGVVGK